MESYKRLLLANKSWVQEKLNLSPNYFKDMSREQKPEFLWIGCSDSRVPAEEITGTQAGEIFVHRNIANIISSTDINLLSVLQFAVDFLKVKHIIVCGHYGCGGVRAALSHQDFGILNKWLRSIKDVYHDHEDEFRNLPDERKKLDRLVELNVEEQVKGLVATSIIQRAWAKEQRPLVHGWVYGLETGLLKNLLMKEPGSPIDDIYRFDF